MEPLAYALGTLIHSVHQMLPPCGRLVKRIKSSLWLKQIFLMPLSIFLKFYCKICFFTTISRYLHEQPIAHRPYALWQDNSSSVFPLASSPQHLSCTPDDHSGEGSLLPTIILSRRLIASPTSYNEPVFKYTLEKKLKSFQERWPPPTLGTVYPTSPSLSTSEEHMGKRTVRKRLNELYGVSSRRLPTLFLRSSTGSAGENLQGQKA